MQDEAGQPEAPTGGERPLLSVVLPTYQRAGVVRVAVESVLSQAGSEVELIVVDDGSTDGTVQMLSGIDDRRLRVLSRGHHGVGVARNDGIAAARGEFVAFLDSDDVLLPGWMDSCRAALADGADLWSCAAELVDDRGGTSVQRPHGMGAAFGDVTALYLAGAFAVRAEILRASGGYLPGLRYGENTALGLAMGELLAGGARSATNDAVLLRIARRARVYDAQLMAESSALVLDRFGDRLALDRKLYGDYLTIAGVAAGRLGRRRDATNLLLRAWRVRPLAWRAPLRVLAAQVPSRRRTTGRRAQLVMRWRAVRRQLRVLRTHPSNRGGRVRQAVAILQYELAALRGRDVVLPFSSTLRVRVRKGGDESSRVAFARLPDWPEMAIWRSWLNQDDLFVDVGANVGLYSLIATERRAIAVAVEPAADMAARLERNMALNRLRSFEVHRVALIDKEGLVALEGPDENRRRVVRDQRGNVRATTLDRIVRGRSPVGMKIDVEGMERLVLDGAARTLADPELSLVQLEWNHLSHDALGEDRAPVAALLRAAGFELFQVDGRGGLLRCADGVPPAGGDVFAARGAGVDHLERAPWADRSRRR